MIVKLLTEHHLEFLSLKGGCRGSSESTHVKMPHCWKSHALAQNNFKFKWSIFRETEFKTGKLLYREAFIVCLIEYFEAEFLWKVSSQNAELTERILETFTNRFYKGGVNQLQEHVCMPLDRVIHKKKTIQRAITQSQVMTST